MFDPSICYDLLIVGAGPAGSTLARLVGERAPEKRVLLIEGQTPGKAKVCGGLLAPDAQKVLAAFDLTLPKSVLVDPQIFSVKTIDVPSGLVRYYSRFYINADRGKFDDWLRSLIPAGVDRFAGRCADLARDRDGGFTAILHPRGEGGRPVTVRSKCVVGADGAASVVRRSFYRCDIRRYTAIQQWFPADERVSPFYSCIFDPETSESCSWSIHKDGMFLYGGSFAPEKCREMFEKQKQRVAGRYGFSFPVPLRTEACEVFRPTRLRDFVTGRDGAFLIGEAAGFISPSSFEGISSAILSATYLARALGCGDPDRAARRYRRTAAKLKMKLRLKCFKRLFMYVPILRRAVMRSGLMAIRMEME